MCLSVHLGTACPISNPRSTYNNEGITPPRPNSSSFVLPQHDLAASKFHLPLARLQLQLSSSAGLALYCSGTQLSVYLPNANNLSSVPMLLLATTLLLWQNSTLVTLLVFSKNRPSPHSNSAFAPALLPILLGCLLSSSWP